MLCEVKNNAINFLEKEGATNTVNGIVDRSKFDDLNQKIAEGKVAEHPGWEDLIELKNIEREIEEIEHDIRTL